MKKLMIAAAIVCVAVMGQAAQVSWTVDWAYSNDGMGINTYDDGSIVNYWIVNMADATDTSGLSVDGTGALVNKDGYGVLDTGSLVAAGNGTTPTTGVVANGDYGNGALGDVLATSFMMSDLEEIKQSEKEIGVNVIVIKDDKILYKSESIELH